VDAFSLGGAALAGVLDEAGPAPKPAPSWLVLLAAAVTDPLAGAAEAGAVPRGAPDLR
jgi:hypothetical protein